MARVVRTVSLVAAASLALVAGCTAPSATPEPDGTAAPTASPSPTEEPAEVHTAELRLPEQPTSVLDAVEPEVRAAAASQAFYASAPVAVVAPLDDPAAQLRAASVSVALGAPLLLAASGAVRAGATAGATDDAATAELDRLGVLAVLTVGDVALEPGDDVTVVPAPPDDDDLQSLLARELTATPAPAPGAELAAVAALDRSAPTLLAPAGGSDAGTPATVAPTAPAPTATPSASPTGEAEDEGDGDGEAKESERTEDEDTAHNEDTAGEDTAGEDTAGEETAGEDAADEDPVLPLTELADPATGALLLTSGDPADVAAVATARSAGVQVVIVPSGDPRADSATVQAFAAARPTHVVGVGAAFGPVEALTWKAATAATGVELPGGGQVLFPNRRFVALYGTPTYPALGLLGEQDAAASIARAQDLVAEYQPLTTDVVVPAFEMIVTVASAGAGDDGNYSNELPIETFIPWIEAAQAAGVYVVIDLQPGRTDFVTQAKLYEPLLRYPNVGLALDPEWRLLPNQVHLRQIGSVHADEINAVADYLAQLTRENHLPQKLLVLHQFMHRMIQARETVVTTRPELAVLIHADGQGSQGAKAGTWASLHQGAPAGVAWGWKNFIDEDIPMLTPAETYAVEPAPQFVSYQ